MSAITLVSCLPLYIIKYLKRKFSPPSYSKLSSWAKPGLLVLFCSFMFHRAFYFQHFFYSVILCDGQVTCGGQGSTGTIESGEKLNNWFLDYITETWDNLKKTEHIKKTYKVTERRAKWCEWLLLEGLKNLIPFCQKGSICLLLFWRFSDKSASSVILYSSDALLSMFKFLYVEFRLFLSVIFYSRY